MAPYIEFEAGGRAMLRKYPDDRRVFMGVTNIRFFPSIGIPPAKEAQASAWKPHVELGTTIERRMESVLGVSARNPVRQATHELGYALDVGWARCACLPGACGCRGSISDAALGISDHRAVVVAMAGTVASEEDATVGAENRARWSKDRAQWRTAWAQIAPLSARLARVARGVLYDTLAMRGSREVACALVDQISWMVDGLTVMAGHLGECVEVSKEGVSPGVDRFRGAVLSRVLEMGPSNALAGGTERTGGVGGGEE